MKKLLEKLDPKYAKICAYASGTAILSLILLMILYLTSDIWPAFFKLTFAVLKPLIIGCIICYLISPVVEFFETRLQKMLPGKGVRIIAVVIALLVVFLILGAIITVIIWSMTKQLSAIDFKAIIGFFVSMQADAETLLANMEALFAKVGLDFTVIGAFCTKFIGSITGFFGSLFFGLIFSIYFLIDGKRILGYWNRVIHALLKQDTLDVFHTLSKEADSCFSGYIRGQSLDALIVGTVTAIILIMVGMPYAALVGLIIGIGNLIPLVGPIMGYVAIVVINVTQWNPKMLIIGLVVVIVIMFLDSNILNPKLLADAVEVHPLLIVAALLAGGAIGGIVGMLIAVPTGAFVKLQFDKWIRRCEANKME